MHVLYEFNQNTVTGLYTTHGHRQTDIFLKTFLGSGDQKWMFPTQTQNIALYDHHSFSVLRIRVAYIACTIESTNVMSISTMLKMLTLLISS